MRGPSGRTSLPSFVALGHLLREINVGLQASYYGVTRPATTGQLAYFRRHFHRKRMALRRHYCTFGMRDPEGPFPLLFVFPSTSYHHSSLFPPISTSLSPLFLIPPTSFPFLPNKSAKFRRSGSTYSER
ncbi:hypothetical protein DPMN_080424 [Dreissena polymorpha]|uniref:Uncharacterized protein n=1 Tax=Dreissena polymorpha TaxID=45954 RepID=A0A9D3YV32_DREPO|nr:hypothetical protein DPMN_080424 [Dreissena polymorpha]